MSIDHEKRSVIKKYCLMALIPLPVVAVWLLIFFLASPIHDGTVILGAVLIPAYLTALSGRFVLRHGAPLPLCWAVSLPLSCLYPYVIYYGLCDAPYYFVERDNWTQWTNAWGFIYTIAVSAIALIIVFVGLLVISCVKSSRKRRAETKG